MKTLVIYNNNIPLGKEIIDNKEIRRVPYKTDLTEGNDFDNSFCSAMDSVLLDEHYDCIILPYTFSDDNYLEYTGLRAAVHIRLTPKWNHTRIPILFIGPDDPKQVAKFSELGQFLFTPRVFTTTKVKTNDIYNMLNWINEYNNQPMGDDEYSFFLKRIVVNPPANYATHHSIANEWAVMRWHKIINWGENEPKLPEHKDFLNMLYFKYLQTKTGFSFDSDDSNNCDNSVNDSRIKGIEGKTIVYIDDEHNKGWESVIGKIIENSNAKLVTFHEFNKDISKQQLIENIKSFIDKQGSTPDCYIIDLRLCDEDFGDCKAKELSGIQVAKYIKFGEGERRKGNRGIPIVAFTASNKVWNLKEAINECNAVDYVVKESPEQNCTNNESLQYYDNFKKAIKKAIDKSYLIGFVNDVDTKISRSKYPETIASLNAYIDLSLIDEEKTLRANVINMCSILEGFCKSNYLFCLNKLLDKKTKTTIKQIADESGNKSMFAFKITKESEVVDVRFFNKLTQKYDFKHDYNYGNEYEVPLCDDRHDISLIISVLKYVYNLDYKLCKLILDLKRDRNIIGHTTKSIDRTTKDSLKEIFEKIIIPIFSK